MFAAVAALAFAACMRIDAANATIRVPGMAAERDRLIITNAAQHQLSGEMPDRKHFCEISLSRGIAAYHEGPGLRDARYVDQIRQSLAAVGYAAEAHAVAFNPLPPRTLEDGRVIDNWPDRHTLFLKIPALRSNTDGNRIVDAIAAVRLGGISPKIQPDMARREMRIRGYNTLHAARCNFEFMIASAGYAANDEPANSGGRDAVPRGWEPADG
jgi:hypothetical protein